MISVEEAEKIILQDAQLLGDETIPLERSRGRVLTESLQTDRDLPPFDRSTMDGIAISSAAYQSGQRSFDIAGTAAAGAPQLRLANPKACLEIMTGAAVPHGADAVVKIEEVVIESGVATISDKLDIVPGYAIHPRGSDSRKGNTVLAKGRRLGAKEIAIAASIGKAFIRVSRIPRICVIATGDELVSIDSSPLPHQIRRSNDRTLATAIASAGFGEPSLVHLIDDQSVVEAAIPDLLAENDVVILAGGISKGKYDFVPDALKANGVGEVFQWVSQRPGKPLWFGSSEHDGRKRPVYALPGNPVSCFTCLHRYVIPALEKMAGLTPRQPQGAKIAEDFHFKPPLTLFLPATLSVDENGTRWARPLPFNTSGDFVSVAQTDGILQLPADQDLFAKGHNLPFFNWID